MKALEVLRNFHSTPLTFIICEREKIETRNIFDLLRRCAIKSEKEKIVEEKKKKLLKVQKRSKTGLIKNI